MDHRLINIRRNKNNLVSVFHSLNFRSTMQLRLQTFEGRSRKCWRTNLFTKGWMEQEMTHKCKTNLRWMHLTTRITRATSLSVTSTRPSQPECNHKERPRRLWEEATKQMPTTMRVQICTSLRPMVLKSIFSSVEQLIIQRSLWITPTAPRSIKLDLMLLNSKSKQLPKFTRRSSSWVRGISCRRLRPRWGIRKWYWDICSRDLRLRWVIMWCCPSWRDLPTGARVKREMEAEDQTE